MKITLNIPDDVFNRVNKNVAEDKTNEIHSLEEALQLFIMSTDEYHAVPMDLEYRTNFDDDIFKHYPMSRINPRQRKNVKVILDNCPEWIDEIWIYGSAITTHCHDTSDLDIVLVDYDCQDIYAALSEMCEWRASLPYHFSCDMQVVSSEMFNNDSLLMHEVREKGMRIK